MTIKAARILWRHHKDGKTYPYYQRFYPAAVRQMLRDMGRDQKIVKRLKDLDSNCKEAELLTARDKEDELFERMTAGLSAANARELTAVAAQQSALAYLAARGIEVGSAKRLQFAQSNKMRIELDLELQENVAEAAWRLVNGEPEDAEESTLVSDAFNAYKRNCISKYARILDRFIAATGDRELNESVNKIVSRWTSNQLQTRGWATVKKDQAIICSALNTKLNELGAGIRIYGYSFKEVGGSKKYVTKQQGIFLREELIEIFNMELEHCDRWAMILSLTCGAINSEILPLTQNKDSIGTLKSCPLVRFPEGKTPARRRHVPVPWLPETPDFNFGENRLRARLSAIVKHQNPAAKPYTLRHSADHYLQAAGATEADRAAICGWSNMGRFHQYGDAGRHNEERLLPLVEIQKRAFGWLFD